MLEDRLEACNLPLSVISQLYREIAGAKSGMLSKAGPGAFVDLRRSVGPIEATTHSARPAVTPSQR